MKFSALVFFLSIFICSCQKSNNNFSIIPTNEIKYISSQENEWIKLKNSESINGYTYYKDSIYGGEINCRIKPLKEIDAQSFEIFTNTEYAKDNNYVLYPLSTICLDYKDCGICYFSKYIIENADPNTFQYLSKDYAKDKNSVYFRGEKIDLANPNTFKVIDGPEFFYFAKDEKNVFMHNNIFKDADPNTFHLESIDSIRRIVYFVSDANNKWEITPPNSIIKLKTNNLNLFSEL